MIKNNVQLKDLCLPEETNKSDLTLEKIHELLTEGKEVYWSNDNYKVVLNKGSLNDMLVWSQCNDHYVGLHEDYLPKCFVK